MESIAVSEDISLTIKEGAIFKFARNGCLDISGYLFADSVI